MEAEFRQHGEGGGTRYQLAREIRKLGHELKVLTQSPGAARPESRLLGELPAWICPETTRIPYCWPADKLLKGIYGYRKAASDMVWLNRFVRREGPFDVAWAMSEEPDGVVCGLAATLGWRLPYLVKVQALRYELDSGQPRFTDQRTLGQGFARAARVVANSPMVERLLAEHYGVPRGKLAWLPPNLTEHFFTGADANRRGQRPEPMSGPVLFLGAINPKKGPDVFLAAATELVRGGLDVRFRMIGGITEPRSQFAHGWPALVLAARLGDRLETLGHLAADDVVREIRGASLVVLPSRIDEFSRAAVECLALGVPIVTTSGVGAAYLVERDESGLVVPPDDPTALARAVERIWKDRHFDLAARSHASAVRSEFAPATLAGRWVELLQQAASAQ